MTEVTNIPNRWTVMLACLIACALFASDVSSAVNGGSLLQNVLVSRSDDRGIVEFRFSCPTRYVFHAPATASDQLRISLVLLEKCGDRLFGAPIRENRRPTGADALGIRDVELIMQGGANLELRVAFEQPMVFLVSQGGDLRSIRLRVDPPIGDGNDLSRFPEPSIVQDAAVAGANSPPTRSAEQIARADAAARAQLKQQEQVSTAATPRFAINLESSRRPIDVAAVNSSNIPDEKFVFISSVKIGSEVWQRLRLGFFSTEAEAEQALIPLAAVFPSAWVYRTDSREATQAVAREGGPKIVATPQDNATAKVATPVQLPATDVAVQFVPGSSLPSAIIPAADRTLTAEQLSQMAADGKAALIAKDYDAALVIYSKLLREPEHDYSRQSQEYLGLVRERNGQAEHAMAEYRRFLDRYPDGDDAGRVRQRLAGLATAGQSPKSLRAGTNERAPSAWNFFGSMSQYYRRDENQFDDQDRIVSQSAVLTDADFVARRRGERFDFGTRMTLGNSYDLLSEQEGTGDSTRIYYLYMDLEDRVRDVSGRLGRQTLHTGGVLGRFDGAHFSYQWRPDLAFNFTTGFPVETTDDGFESARFFYGMSVDFVQLLELFDVNVYFNTQDVDGLEDRQAVGTDIRYFDGNKSLVSTIDYDISYSELNSFVMLGNWRFDNRITLNAMLDKRNSPYLTTQNALIGQPVATIDELLLTFTEDEVRQFAVDRTSEVQTYALGISTPLFERFQVNADVSVSDFGGTSESGGVAALPDFGKQTYYSLSVIGSSLLKAGDVSIFGLRYTDSDTSNTTTLSFDTRYPMTDRFRVNPRLQLISREDTQSNIDQLIAKPSLRLFYRMGRKMRLELDVGGEWADREAANVTTDSSAYFIYAGYRADL